MALDLQRKYRYVLTIDTTNATYKDTLSVIYADEVTLPDIRQEPVTRHNRALGQISLVGPRTYGEVTFRIALRAGNDGEATVTQDTINALQSLYLNDVDTCNVHLKLNTLESGDDTPKHEQDFLNCRVTGFKLDPLGRKDDGDFVHFELTLIPSVITNVKAVA